MTVHSPTLLDHVSAYAAAVRSQLSDLAPEQVDDLTDGLEADLAEALEDPLGPERLEAERATEPGRLLDLTRRFGPAAAYAAELRAAAGLGGAVPGGRRGRPGARRVRERLAGLRTRWQDAWRPVLATPLGKAVATFALSLRPLWWVARGWVWFVLLGGVVGGWRRYSIDRYVPGQPAGWLLLGACVLLSVNAGRGLGQDRRWVRRLTAVASVLAILLLPWATTELRREITVRAYAGAGVGEIVYVDVPTELPVADGVWVDGMQVSNLFVYDAAGDPLHGVQIFDDRGRPVRTTYDEGQQDWSMPGVKEAWTFAASLDEYGRARWNVYPLAGAPSTAWTYDDTGQRTVEDPDVLQLPPAPFAKAPRVTGPGVPAAPDGAPEATAAPGEPAADPPSSVDG